jgi:CheY-like chemotaxis protein/HPt (histidine-containing phosphotransfer) domain-containing protein
LSNFAGNRHRAVYDGEMPSRTKPELPAGFLPPAQQTSNATAVAPNGPLRGLRVLVAEDNPVNAMLAHRLLETLGCQADIVASGNEALAMHADERYDFIIMDCQMDGLDGFAATRRLRATESGNEKTPVVGWTSDADGQRARCLASGMDDVLPKPLGREALAQVLGRWRRERGQADAPPEAIPATVDDELRALHDLFGDAFAEVASIYTAETPRRLASLDFCLANRDPTGAARLAHALSGSSASIGARSVSKLCRTLELDCCNGRLQDIPMLREAIDRAYSDFNERLMAAVAATRG